MDTYSRDKVAVLEELRDRHLGWDTVGAALYRSAKHHYCDAYTHHKVVRHEKFKSLPQHVRKRIDAKNYLTLVVRNLKTIGLFMTILLCLL